MRRQKGLSGWTIFWIVLGISLILFFFFILLIPFVLIGGNFSLGGNVALITINGPIQSSAPGGLLFGSSGVSSEEIVKFIADAEEDPFIDAILFDINSPGGAAVASEEIARAIKETEKPTVALIRDVGASGAYWAASATDHIIASPVSITGSIGVLGGYLEFSELFEEFGIGYERFVGGKYKDIGSPFRNLSDEERAIMQDIIDSIHEDFIDSVAENRDMLDAELRPLATGRIFTGRQALEVGLIDELGGKQEAEEHLKQLIGAEEIEYRIYQRESSLFGSFAVELPFSQGLRIST